mmetsp:Transcript_57920/g.125787  ORF Transcript_57920/g.125787 Transcript_57920/m.125787 type:complete len:146 (-) Transcript_57920:575-1012(-)|eukprot:3086067-Pleurochrysis_carterae.AAC.5
MVEYSCPLCLERPATSATECGHKFCRACIERWTAVRPNCPMCRRFVEPVPTSRFENSPAVPFSAPTAMTLREQAEMAEAARLEARARQQALAGRIDGYRSTFITPSGRPFESLPLATVEELRNLRRGNKQALAGLCLRQHSHGVF